MAKNRRVVKISVIFLSLTLPIFVGFLLYKSWWFNKWQIAGTFTVVENGIERQKGW